MKREEVKGGLNNMETKDKTDSRDERIKYLEQHVDDLRMAFITALDLIDTYKKWCPENTM